MKPVAYYALFWYKLVFKILKYQKPIAETYTQGQNTCTTVPNLKFLLITIGEFF